MSDKYPTLASMGVKNPLQIAGFSVYQSRENTDVLRIKYQRPKGSFLPVTSSYKFVRTAKSAMVDSGSRKTATIYEVSTLLDKATNELESIVQGKKNRQELKQQIVAEIERMEYEYRAELAGLKQMVKQLED